MLNNSPLEEVAYFTYLGNKMSINSTPEKEVNIRIGMVKYVFMSLQGCLWKMPVVTLSTKLKVYLADTKSTHSDI